MTFPVQRMFALVAVAALLAGGSRCPCAAAITASTIAQTKTPLVCHVPKACDDTSRSCCPRPELAAGAAATNDDRDTPPAVPGPTAPCTCDACTTHVAPAPPELKSAARLATPAFAPVLLDQSTLRETVATASAVTAAPDIPPQRDRLTLYALHCSLLD